MENFEGFVNPIEQPSQDVGDWSLLKKIASVATNTPEPDGQVNFDTTLRDAYKHVSEKNMALDMSIAREEAAAGNPTGVENAVASVYEQLRYNEGVQRNRIKELGEVAQAAIDNIVASSPKVVLNNSPQQLARASSAAVPGVAVNTFLEEMSKKAGSATGIAGSVLWSFTPPSGLFTGYNITEFAKQFIGERASLGDSQKETLAQLHDYVRTLEPDEAATFGRNMYDHLRNTWAITDNQAAQMTLEVMAGEDAAWYDGAIEALEKAAVPLTLLGVGAGIARSVRSATAATKAAKVEHQLAALGAKDSVVTTTSTRLAAKAAAQAAGTITGASDIVDATKLVSMSIGKVLPGSITTASTEVQNVVKNIYEKTLADLATTLKAKNIRDTEGEAMYRALEAKWNPAVNKEIHSWQPMAADGSGPSVFLKPKDESSYLTREAAELALKLKDPTGTLGMKVVPDTTNTGYLVSDDVLNARKIQRSATEAQILELKNKLLRVETAAKKTSVPPTPASILTSKPNYAFGAKQFTLNFESDVDKALYMLGSKTASSKIDAAVAPWLSEVLGKKDAALQAVINKEAQDIRNFLKDKAKGLEGGSLTIPPRVRSKAASVGDNKKKLEEALTKLTKTLEFEDEQIAAMEGAKKGLVQGWLIEHKPQPIANIYSTLGKYTQEDINSMVRWSLGDWALGTSSELYANRVVGVSQASRYQKVLTDAVRPSLEKLSRMEKGVLNDILVQGDKMSKEFDAVELKGMGATDNVVEAYYVIRGMRNNLHLLRDEVAVTDFTRRGYKKLNMPLTMDEPGQIFGRRVEVENVKVTNVWSVSDGASMSAKELAKKSEVVFYELQSPISIGNKKHKHVAVHPNAVTEEAITTVIPYRQGEFKRIYSDEYFVKYKGTETIDGDIVKDKLYTHRTAATKAEGQAYADTFNNLVSLHRKGTLTLAEAAKMQAFGWKPEEFIEALNSGKFGDNPNMTVLYNRTDDDYFESFESTASGQFSYERGEHIPNVNGESTVNTVNPLDSLAAEITNTAFMVPTTEWRAVAIHRWYNTVRDVLPDAAKDLSPDAAFEYMWRNKGDYFGTDQEKLFARRVQEYVMHEVRTLTRDEQAYQGAMRVLSESIEKMVGGTKLEGAVATSGSWLRQAEPATFFRTVAFHSFLGGFNPVQLLVQGLNAFNAFAIRPMYGLKAARQATALRVALMSDNPDVWASIAKFDKLSSLGLSDAEEFASTVRAIRNSGILDGINSTSLYGAQTGKYGLFNGFSRKAGEFSAFFFNRGEEMSRITAYSIAKMEWQAANKGQDWLSSAAQNAIIERMDDLTQNMTRANQAQWQKGFLSIPTQFMQYQVKIHMNLLASALGNSRVFTRPQAFRLLVSHGLMWGSAGAGLSWAMEEFMGKAGDDWPPELRTAFNEGVASALVSVAAQAITGEDMALALGSRFNTFGWIPDMWQRLTGPNKVSSIELLLGAPGAAIARFGGNAAMAWDVLSANSASPESIAQGTKLLLTGAFSSLNNVEKAIVAKNNLGYVTSKSNDKLYVINQNEINALLIGLPSVASADYEKSLLYLKNKTELAKKLAKEVASLQVKATDALLAGDKVGAEQYRNVIHALYNKETDPQLRRLITQELYKSTGVNTKLRSNLIELLDSDKKPLLVKQLGDTE